MLSSRRSLIVTFMGPVLLGALSLAAYGCGSSNDNTAGTKSTSCSAKPSGCKAGTTCWVANTNGDYACLPAKASAGKGSSCRVTPGQAQCAEGLTCFANQSSNGVCMPFCENGTCGANEDCFQMHLTNVSKQEIILVCGPSPVADAGPESSGSDATTTDSGSDATATDSGSDATATDSGSDATATDSGSDATATDAAAD